MPAPLPDPLAAAEAEREPTSTFDEALAYIRPHPATKGPVILKAGMLRCCVSAILMRESAILSRLTAAETERDELRVSVQRMHRRCQSGEADLQSLVDHLRSAVDIWMKACRSAETERDALRARAERAEKALEPFASFVSAIERQTDDAVLVALGGYGSHRKRLTVGDVRHAAAVFSPTQDPDEGRKALKVLGTGEPEE